MNSASLRTKKGLIEIELKSKSNVIEGIKITGDFFIYPEDKLELLEQFLINTKATKEILEQKITEFYTKSGVTTPGIEVADWVTVILKALDSNNE